MSNPNKAKGDRAERAVVNWLRDRGLLHAFKTRAGFDDDRGDIVIPDPASDGEYAGAVVLQVKDVGNPLWSKWHAQVADQTTNARAALGVIVHKRRGVSDPGQWNVVMTGEQFLGILEELGYAPRKAEIEPDTPRVLGARLTG